MKLQGVIYVERIMQEARQPAWEAEKAKMEQWESCRRMQRLEEREARRWIAKAKSNAERERVKALYREAFTRMQQQKLVY